MAARAPVVVRLVGHGTSDNAASYGVYAFGLLPGWTALRDTIAGKMRAVLSAAAFSGQTINEPRTAQYISIAQGLLDEVSQCVANTATCAGVSQ
jgi:hypothetical protein